jgi:N-succinyl-L-ornithine transcarbamylase
MMEYMDADFVIAHPEGYSLNPAITKGVKSITNQEEALKEADFVYAKNWCSYEQYGQILRADGEWMLTSKKMKLTNNGKFMHCLPIRRNVVAADKVLDSPNSLIIKQSENRIYAAQVILKQLLENG